MLLSAATLLSPPPWHLLCQAMGRPPGDAAMLSARSASAQDCLAAPLDPPAWARRLRAALQQVLAAPPVPG